MKFARIVPEISFSFNDHPLRKPSIVLYFCGCPHKCKGCHSKELQDLNSNLCIDIKSEELFNTVSYYITYYKDYLNGLVLLGGDPLVHTDFLIEFLSLLKKEHDYVNVALYTGYLFDEVKEELKNLVDVIVDGKYVEDLKTNKFPASSNQRVFIKENNKWKEITHLFFKNL